MMAGHLALLRDFGRLVEVEDLDAFVAAASSAFPDDARGDILSRAVNFTLRFTLRDGGASLEYDYFAEEARTVID